MGTFIFGETLRSTHSQTFFFFFSRAVADTKPGLPGERITNSPKYIALFRPKLDLTTLHDTYRKPEQKPYTTMCSSETWHLLCEVRRCKSKASKAEMGY